MKTKLMALEALMKLPESSSVEDYGINFEIVETFLRQSIEADIAKPVEPFAWCIDSKNSADWCFSATESGVKLNAELMHEDCEKTEPFPVFTTPQEPADRNPYGWQVQGLRDTFKGDHAEMDAKAEAARVGGTAYAFPIYIDPTAVTESTP